jgi:hypothetical protein
MASLRSEYYAAVDKATGEVVAVSESAVGVLADAAEKTGLPRDEFELHEISRKEYERLKEPWPAPNNGMRLKLQRSCRLARTPATLFRRHPLSAFPVVGYLLETISDFEVPFCTLPFRPGSPQLRGSFFKNQPKYRLAEPWI